MDHDLFKKAKRPIVLVNREWRNPKSRRSATLKNEVSGHKTVGPTEKISLPAIPPDTPENLEKRAEKSGLKKFEFVNATSKPDRNRDPDVRKFVRAQVMKNYSSAKRQKRQEDLSDKSSDQRCTVSKTLPTRKANLAVNTSNTFVRLPPCLGEIVCTTIYLDPQLQKLLLQYYGIVSRTELLNSHLTENVYARAYFRIAMNDEVSIHALLYAAAICIRQHSNSPEMRIANMEMSHALRLIHDRIQQSQSNISDGVLGAVSCLAWGTASCGQLEDWNAHMAGIKKMVQLRGGMSTLSKVLRVKLAKADLAGAVEKATTPYLGMTPSDSLALPFSLGPLESDVEEETFLRILSCNRIQQSLIKTLRNIRGFSQAVDHAMKNKSIHLDYVRFTSYAHSLQYQLLQLEPNDAGSMNESCRIVALIYLREVLKPYHLTRRGPQYLIGNLKNSLGDLNDVPPYSAALVLWILVMVGISAKTITERMWAVAQLAKISSVLKVFGWEDVQNILESLIWIKHIQEWRCKELWEEVEVARRI